MFRRSLSRRAGAPIGSPTVVAAVLVLSILAGEALAQTPPVTLAPVVVTAPAPDSLVTPSLEDARQEIRRVPGGGAVVPAEDFRDRRPVGVKDMLDYVPGVFAQPKFGEDSKLSIRGSGLARNFHLRGVRLLQDGIPLNAADGAGDFQEVEPLAQRYVEVFKGANALRYGAASLGGAINFVSPTGHDAPKFLARTEAGSFDFFRFQLASGMKLGDFDYYLTPTWIMQDGFRRQSAQNDKRLNGNVGIRLGDAGETRFFVNLNDVKQEVPGSLSRHDALHHPRRAPAGNIANDYARDIQGVRLANKTSFLLGEAAQAEIGGYYARKSLYHPIFQVLDNELEDYGAFARAMWEGTLAGHRNRLSGGFSAARGFNDNKRFVNVGGRRGAKTWDSDETTVNYELYAENQFYIAPQFALVAGFQFGHSRRKAEDDFLADGSDDSAKKNFTWFSPKLGFLWDVSSGVQVFGNVSRSVEPPSFSELNPSAAPGFADLKAQKAWTAELGARGSWSIFDFDVAIYRARLKDELQQFVDPATSATFSLNAGRTIHQGVELGLTARLAENLFAPDAKTPDRLVLRQAYTFSDFRFDGDPSFGDNKLPGVPRHYYRAELVYSHPSGFFLGPNLEWVPQAYWIDNANTVKTKPYALLGARAGYDFGNGLRLFADARNLTDEKYIGSVGVVPVATAANANVFNPGDGRAVYAGLEFRW
ncbi:MAG: TonB-dependent receptor family protein [Reyranellaceae bacterium]